jgi:Asp-tRNA(Asn)/Glu-tRNA(Gln) amidotransferase A subunit family amidase
MTSDGYFEPVPACQRAVLEAVEALKSQGHEVVPFEVPYSSSKMVETYISLMGADGNWYLPSLLAAPPHHHSSSLGTTI